MPSSSVRVLVFSAATSPYRVLEIHAVQKAAKRTA
jgi:hypothetical protein